MTGTLRRRMMEYQQRRAASHREYHAAEASRYAAIKANLDADRTVDGIPNDWFRMTDCVGYDATTGEIVSHGRMSVAGVKHNAEATGVPHIAGTGHPDRHFVDVATGEIKAKTKARTKLVGTTITALPVPCKVMIEGPGRPPLHQVIACTDPSDTTLELNFDFPGEYRATVCSARHHPVILTIKV